MHVAGMRALAWPPRLHISPFTPQDVVHSSCGSSAMHRARSAYSPPTASSSQRAVLGASRRRRAGGSQASSARLFIPVADTLSRSSSLDCVGALSARRPHGRGVRSGVSYGAPRLSLSASLRAGGVRDGADLASAAERSTGPARPCGCRSRVRAVSEAGGWPPQFLCSVRSVPRKKEGEKVRNPRNRNTHCVFCEVLDSFE